MRHAESSPVPPPDTGNSRDTRTLAGWDGDTSVRAGWRDLLDARKRNRWGNFTWISPGPLLASMNDVVAKGMDDLINTIRPRWVAQQQGFDPPPEALQIDHSSQADGVSFLLLGDPGEQDASQYAVVAPALAKAEGTDFMLIASDVIYPAGDINDYIDGFYLPYRGYEKPIYAIPGNHDWYDGLNGFMWHFCGAEPLPPVAYRAGSFLWKERLARSLWRKPSPPKLAQLLYERSRLCEERQTARQPGPYFTIKTKELLIVCIDTGITGKLDRQQGEWLRTVSCREGPKVLITGKPIYADGAYHPGEIDWGPAEDKDIDKETRAFKTVDDIVREKRHDYRAVIGGDVHNYQRYWVDVVDEVAACEENEVNAPPTRTIHYLVAGGSGAYLSATHRFDRVDLEPEFQSEPIPVERIKEDKFWCYPLRGDSLARFVRRSSVGIALMLVAAILILAVGIWILARWSNYEVDHFDAELWKAVVTVPAALVAAAVALRLGIYASNEAVPLGYRAMTATVLTVSIAALTIAGAIAALPDWDNLIWKMAVTTLLGVLVPVAMLVGYFVLRDFIAPSVRLAMALALPLALVVITVELDSVALEVGLALLALWLGILVAGRLRRVDATTATKRLRASRLVPAALAVGALVAILASLWDEIWIPTALAIALATTLFLLAVGIVAVGWRGVRALPWLIPGRIDPDETARWVATRLEIDPVRPAARTAQPSLKTRALASAIYKTPRLKGIISEAAEATGPPFFKSFLRLDISSSELVITAFGVTGLAADQGNPSVEDVVHVSLEPR